MITPDTDYQYERQIEIPLAKDYLLRQKAKGAKRVAGIGDAECLYIDWILEQGFEFCVVDPARWGDNQKWKDFINHPNFSILKRSIHDTPITKDLFDCALLISTLEHLGRAGYNSPVFSEPEVTCFRNIKVPFCFSTPAGALHQVGSPPDMNYSKEYLVNALATADKETLVMDFYAAPDWHKVDYEYVKDRRYGEKYIGANAVCFAEIG